MNKKMDLVKYLNNNHKIFMPIYKIIWQNDALTFLAGFYSDIDNVWFLSIIFKW